MFGLVKLGNFDSPPSFFMQQMFVKKSGGRKKQEGKKGTDQQCRFTLLFKKIKSNVKQKTYLCLTEILPDVV